MGWEERLRKADLGESAFTEAYRDAVAATPSVRAVKFRANPACRVCGEAPTIRALEGGPSGCRP